LIILRRYQTPPRFTKAILDLLLEPAVERQAIESQETTVTQERLALSAEREALVRVAGQRSFEAVGKVRSRLAQHDVDVLGRACAVA
jgi:hypothetical protein